MLLDYSLLKNKFFLCVFSLRNCEMHSFPRIIIYSKVSNSNIANKYFTESTGIFFGTHVLKICFKFVGKSGSKRFRNALQTYKYIESCTRP